MSETATVQERANVYRGELIGYCYRFFGSYAEAEDAVQETMLRSWQRGESFDERSSLRTWLYRVATNVCLDMQRSPQRRSLPMDLTAAGHVPSDPTTLSTQPEASWIWPLADHHVGALTDSSDPAEVAISRQTIRLAFIAALQLLPPRQRVVLILRDVLDWSAQETAGLLEDSLPSVNSALARARRTLAAHRDSLHRDMHEPSASHDPDLLNRYVAAFEAYDVDRLVGLLAEDARFSMPPFELWLQGVDAIEQWWRGPGQVCRNSRTMITRANGQPAVAVYHHVAPSRWEPFALHVLDTLDGHIIAITHFMGRGVFDQFGLPEVLGEQTSIGSAGESKK